MSGSTQVYGPYGVGTHQILGPFRLAGYNVVSSGTSFVIQELPCGPCKSFTPKVIVKIVSANTPAIFHVEKPIRTTCPLEITVTSGEILLYSQ